MKSIIHVMGMDSTKYGGIERFNVELSKQLYTRGFHSVFVYEEYPHVQQFIEDLQNTGAEIYVINSRKNAILFCRKIWQLYNKYNFCTIHAHFTKARFYALPLALIFGIKNVFYTFHSSIDTLDKIKFHTRFWYRIMNKFCKVISVSKDIEKTAKTNWKSINCKTLYLGVGEIIGDKKETRKELKISLNQMVLMCTANFNYIKGLDILVKAIKLLVDNGAMKDSKLYIVGQPQKDKEELHQLIDKLQISNYIQLEGIKNNIQQYLLAADIYIQPSRYEGIGLAIMEACSAKLPVIASRVGGIPEVAIENRNAHLFESENVEELACMISKLLKDNKQRKLLGDQSKEIYDEFFSIQTNVAKLIDYYNLE